MSAGIPPFPNEAGLDRRLDAVVRSRALVATTDTAQASAGSSVVVIVVPLLVDDEADPDFTAIDAATACAGSGLQPGLSWCTRPRSPSGPLVSGSHLRSADASGLSLGTDLFVAHSPERVFSGRVFADLSRYPKLVGGVDATSGTSRRGASTSRSCTSTTAATSNAPTACGTWAVRTRPRWRSSPRPPTGT
ncbi:MAG: hypothetical protein M5U19_14350 [Microthrixaceae bacterium]|nr:hypothetical protein [Microthrixaceae bacterium]